MAGGPKTLRGILQNIGTAIKGLFTRRSSGHGDAVAQDETPRKSLQSSMTEVESSPRTSHSRDSTSSLDEEVSSPGLSTKEKNILRTEKMLLEASHLTQRYQYGEADDPKGEKLTQHAEYLQSHNITISRTADATKYTEGFYHAELGLQAASNAKSDEHILTMLEIGIKNSPYISKKDQASISGLMENYTAEHLNPNKHAVKPASDKGKKDATESPLSQMQNALKAASQETNRKYYTEKNDPTGERLTRHAEYLLTHNVEPNEAKIYTEGLFLAEQALAKRADLDTIIQKTNLSIMLSPHISEKDKSSVFHLMSSYANDSINKRKAEPATSKPSGDKGKEEAAEMKQEAATTPSKAAPQKARPFKPEPDFKPNPLAKIFRDSKEDLTALLKDKKNPLVESAKKDRYSVGKSDLSSLTPSPSHVANLSKGGKGVIEK